MFVKRTVKKIYLLLTAVVAFALIGAGCQKQTVPSPADVSVPVDQGSPAEGQNVKEGSEAPEPAAPVEAGIGAAMPAPGSQVNEVEAVKLFEIVAKNFEFSLKEIRVKKGDKVRIILKDEQGFHDWVLDEFNVRTPQISASNTATVEFVADKVGTFEYYCSVDQHRQMGMKGNLVVEE